MSRTTRRVGLLVGLIASIALIFYARDAFHGQDLSRYATKRSLLAISIAAICYSTIIPTSAWAWRALLADLEVRKSWLELTEIMAISQLAKYVPGNIGVHLGRAGMAMSRGIKSGPIIFSMLSETVLAVAAAFVVGIIGILVSVPGTKALQNDLQTSLVISAVLVASTPFLYFVLRHRLMAFVQNIARHRGWSMSSRLLPGFSTSLRAFAAYTVNYLFIGVAILVMATIMFPKIDHDAGLLCASFALAWVAGFFTPGAPAGLGVREALMLGILDFSYNPMDALVIVIALRLATMLGDVLTFICGYALMLSSRRRLSPS